MSTGILRHFYCTQTWIKCRNAYFIHAHGLCEICSGKGEIVHHKEPLSSSDIMHNPAKCYGYDNLQLLCRVCHELQHSSRGDGLAFDANGDIIFTKTAKELSNE